MEDSHCANKNVFSDCLNGCMTGPAVRSPSADCSRLEVHAVTLKCSIAEVGPRPTDD